MKIAFVVYDGMTLLDFAGVYDPLTRLKSMGFLPDLAYDTCARTDRVTTSEGTVLVPGRVINDLSCYSLVIIPGGEGVKDLVQDKAFLAWIAVASDHTTVAALCGGSLLLGAAGLLRARRATTHPQMMSVLEKFARETSPDRIVDEGKIITAGGVAAGIDLGLYLCEKIAGQKARETIANQMDYRQYCTR
jgi:transcriptional regulator GlxA family with amidase domain